MENLNNNIQNYNIQNNQPIVHQQIIIEGRAFDFRAAFERAIAGENIHIRNNPAFHLGPQPMIIDQAPINIVEDNDVNMG